MLVREQWTRNILIRGFLERIIFMASISSYPDHQSHATGILVTTEQRLVQRFLNQNVWLDFLKMYASVIYVNVHFSVDSFLGIHRIFTGVHAKNKG